MDQYDELLVIEFPIASFPEGEISPPMQTDHPTWALMGPWTDPMADRGAYNTPSGKTRVATPHGPAIEFAHPRQVNGLIAGEPEWRDVRLTCRLTPVDRGTPWGPYDGWFLMSAHAGLAFRIETSRRYYFFCVEARDRVVLYRRRDDDWHVLDWKPVTLPDGPVTLRVEASGDTLRASCPECGVNLWAVDTAFPVGKIGFRNLGRNRLFALRVEIPAAERAQVAARQAAARAQVAQRGRDVPDAVPAGELELAGGMLAYTNFADSARNDFLLSGPDGLIARTADGRELWRSPERPCGMFRLGPARDGGGRLLYLMTGARSVFRGTTVGGTPDTRTVADEVVVLDGVTGRERMRTRLPDDPSPAGMLTYFDFSVEVGCGGTQGELDFVVRQWRSDYGDGGVDLWAFDAAGRQSWHRRVDTPYGHSNAVHIADLNRDGRLEVLAGGFCYSAAGDPLWVHDLADEMRRISGAGHYDAALVQPPAAWPHADPLVMLIGGSAGVYVVDAFTGRTRRVYRVGHAQWANWCRLRGGDAGPQFMVGCRWTNYGILILFDAAGKRLWAIQPDYVLQGSGAIQWCAGGPQHLWINTSEAGMGLYDGDGRLVNPLAALRAVFHGRTRKEIQAFSIEREPGGRNWLALRADGRVHLFRPAC